MTGCKDIDDALHCKLMPNGLYEVGVRILSARPIKTQIVSLPSIQELLYFGEPDSYVSPPAWRVLCIGYSPLHSALLTLCVALSQSAHLKTQKGDFIPWSVSGCIIDIADVTNFVHPGTPLDEEASQRGTSVYMVERRIDMLPKPLTEGIYYYLWYPFLE